MAKMIVVMIESTGMFLALGATAPEMLKAMLDSRILLAFMTAVALSAFSIRTSSSPGRMSRHWWWPAMPEESCPCR